MNRRAELPESASTTIPHQTGSPPIGRPAGYETEPPVTVIVPPRGWVGLDLREVWRYRDLLALLVWRDVSATYRQSVVGYGWAILRPAITILIFTVVFGRIAGLPTDGIPKPLFYLSALLPWNLFAAGLLSATGSVVASQGMLTKVYFPRLILPLASLGKGLAEFAVQTLILAALMAWYGVPPGVGLPLAPAFVLLAVTSSLAVGLFLTALNVKYRDVGQVVPFFVQAGMWMTPVVYPASLIPERWRFAYGLNPMVGAIEGFRWAVLGGGAPDWRMIATSSVAVVVLLVAGAYYFRRTESRFADLI